MDGGLNEVSEGIMSFQAFGSAFVKIVLRTSDYIMLFWRVTRYRLVTELGT